MLVKIGNRITTLRKDKKLSQEELAELLNVSRQTISKWENQEVLPDAYNLMGLSRVFNISTDELLFGKMHTVYNSIGVISDLKRNNITYKRIGIILVNLAALLFIVPLIIMSIIGVEDPPFGLVAVVLVIIFGIISGIAVSYFIKSHNCSSEYKYLERLEYEKQRNES